MPGMDLEILGDMGYGPMRPYGRREWGRHPGGYGAPPPMPYASPYAQPYGAIPPWHPHHPHHHHWRQQQAMMGDMGYNPQLAMMGKGHGGGAPWFNYLAGPDDGGGPPPMGEEHVPLAMVQPSVPGVSQRGGRVQPLGFTPGRFTDASGLQLDVTATPQRPIRGGRLVGSFSRIGTTATGLLFVASLFVGTDGQLLSADPISFDALSPTAFGVGVNFTPASVGNQVVASVTISDAPASEDSVPFSLTLFGLTVG
jgi:hypothetical protein